MTTLEDVAKKVGLSLMTVSRVVNNKGNVAEETRKLVLEAVKELKYYPNALGRALNSSKMQTIGVMGAQQGIAFENPYYTEILSGIEKACIRHSYDLLMSTYRLHESEMDYLRNYMEKKVDGMIFVVPDINHPQFHEAAEMKMPAIVIGERPREKEIPYIDSDNFDAGSRATLHLIEKGHQKIAFIKTLYTNRNVEDRYLGYQETMKKHGFDIHTDWVIDTKLDHPTGREAFRKLVQIKEVPTAIICANDLSALGVMAEAQSMGYSIPKDFSIIGFDGIPAGQYTHPPLTTFKQPMEEMGFTAAEMLFEKLNHPETRLHSRIFPMELSEGQSVRDLSENP